MLNGHPALRGQPAATGQEKEDTRNGSERDKSNEEGQHADEEVLEQQGKSSRNSSNPPSSDSDQQRKKRRRKSSSNRQRGAQPGHKKNDRPMHPSDQVDQVDQVHQHFPDHHCRCGGCVVMNAEPSIRHQVFELPPPRYIVDEHQVFDGHCERCHLAQAQSRHTVIKRL